MDSTRRPGRNDDDRYAADDGGDIPLRDDPPTPRRMPAETPDDASKTPRQRPRLRMTEHEAPLRRQKPAKEAFLQPDVELSERPEPAPAAPSAPSRGASRPAPLAAALDPLNDDPPTEELQRHQFTIRHILLLMVAVSVSLSLLMTYAYFRALFVIAIFPLVTLLIFYLAEAGHSPWRIFLLAWAQTSVQALMGDIAHRAVEAGAVAGRIAQGVVWFNYPLIRGIELLFAFPFRRTFSPFPESREVDWLLTLITYTLVFVFWYVIFLLVAFWRWHADEAAAERQRELERAEQAAHRQRGDDPAQRTRRKPGDQGPPSGDIAY